MKRPDFERLLDVCCGSLTHEARKSGFKTSLKFENRVREVLDDLLKDEKGMRVDFDSPPQAFPDIALGEYGVEDNINKNFTLQNGAQILSTVFKNIRKENYEDSLAVTEIDDLIGYIYSLSSMTTLSSVPKEEIREVLAKHMENGVLRVPKEYGMFCCRKGL